MEITLDYNMEESQDRLLHEIKDICFAYLDNKNIDYISDDELFIAYEFLVVKFNELMDLKSGLNLKSYSFPFKEISHSLDEITVGNEYEVKGNINKYPKLVLTKELNYTLDHLGFCYGIINKIIQERDI